MGAFAAVMLGAFITTNDTYLHSWGSIFVQDIVLPLRRKPLSPKQHILWLRLSILFVAVFAFCFSLVFQQTEYILLFFAITGPIYAGGSGSVIIGGLYWKKGTTAAAWGAMITGSVVSVGGIICQQNWERWFGGAQFPINGQVFWLIAILSSVAVYVAVSLVRRERDFDMDSLLHRGRFAVEEDGTRAGPSPAATAREPETVGARMLGGIKLLLGSGRDFTRRDRFICRVTYAWVMGWFGVLVIGTVVSLTGDVTDSAWMKYWYATVVIRVVASVMILVWFTCGGVLDLRKMFARLKTMQRDDADDGTVREDA
jgi:SSS family solute:Na+ symporter